MDDKVKSQVFTDAYEGNDDSVIKLLATDSNLVTALDSVSTGLILGPVLSGHTIVQATQPSLPPGHRAKRRAQHANVSSTHTVDFVRCAQYCRALLLRESSGTLKSGGSSASGTTVNHVHGPTTCWWSPLLAQR